MTTPRRAALYILVAASAYGSLSIITTLAADEGVGLLSLMAWRYTIALPILVGIAGWARVRAVPWRRALALVLLGGAGQTAVTYFSLSALEWLPAASLGFLFYTYPAWVALLMAATGVERLTGLRVGALGLALFGVTLMVGAPWNLQLPLPGVIRALAAAVVYALYIPVLQQLRGELDTAAASAYIIGGAAAVFLLAAWREGSLASLQTPAAWGLALAVAVYCTVVAFITFLRGLEVLGPVRSSILSTSEPLFTAVLALAILGQPLGLGTLLGGACIVAAIVVLERATPAVSDTPAPL